MTLQVKKYQPFIAPIVCMIAFGVASTVFNMSQTNDHQNQQFTSIQITKMSDNTLAKDA